VARKRIAMTRLRYDKVFGIGATKTGTSSFGAAMELLGFHRHLGWSYRLASAYERGDLDPVLAAARKYEVFEDKPWASGTLYEVLADRFPRARFVLTVRDTAAWSVSHERHYAPGSAIPEILWIPDYAARRDEIVAEYEQRNAAIRAHFADQPDRLLVIDVTQGDAWATLCPFLGLPIPPEPFPVVNASPSADAQE